MNQVTSHKTLTFNIANVLHGQIGSTDNFPFSGSVNFEGIITKSDISGELEIMKIDEGVNVLASNLYIDIQLECLRCLGKYSYPINIEEIDSKFLRNLPDLIEDPSDIHLIDKKHQKIDLTELFRQEIILHFPTNSVCSSSCGGICSQCGINMNKKNCNCQDQESQLTEHKPLSALKKLLNK